MAEQLYFGDGLFQFVDGHQVQAYDGRETAPAAAHENLFLKPDGKPMAFAEIGRAHV